MRFNITIKDVINEITIIADKTIPIGEDKTCLKVKIMVGIEIPPIIFFEYALRSVIIIKAAKDTIKVKMQNNKDNIFFFFIMVS